MEETASTVNMKAAPASFTSIPPEIRNLIYKHLLVRRAPIPAWGSGPNTRSYGIFDAFFAERWGHLVPLALPPRATGSSPSAGSPIAIEMSTSANLWTRLETTEPAKVHPATSQRLHTSILSVSKTTYAEALPLLYSENTFVVEIRDGGTEWAADYVPQRHLVLIKHLYVSMFFHASYWQARGHTAGYVRQGRSVSEEIRECSPRVESVSAEIVRLGLDEFMTGVDDDTNEVGRMIEDENGERFEILEKHVKDMMEPWVQGFWPVLKVSGDMADVVKKELEATSAAAYLERKLS